MRAGTDHFSTAQLASAPASGGLLASAPAPGTPGDYTVTSGLYTYTITPNISLGSFQRKAQSYFSGNNGSLASVGSLQLPVAVRFLSSKLEANLWRLSHCPGACTRPCPRSQPRTVLETAGKPAYGGLSSASSIYWSQGACIPCSERVPSEHLSQH